MLRTPWISDDQRSPCRATAGAPRSVAISARRRSAPWNARETWPQSSFRPKTTTQAPTAIQAAIRSARNIRWRVMLRQSSVSAPLLQRVQQWISQPAPWCEPRLHAAPVWERLDAAWTRPARRTVRAPRAERERPRSRAAPARRRRTRGAAPAALVGKRAEPRRDPAAPAEDCRTYGEAPLPERCAAGRR